MKALKTIYIILLSLMIVLMWYAYIKLTQTEHVLNVEVLVILTAVACIAIGILIQRKE